MTRVLGVDFTCAPRRSKPLRCAMGVVEGDRLRVERIESAVELAGFSAWLSEPGPWLMAVDFPLGQPAELWSHLQAWDAGRGQADSGERSGKGQANFGERVLAFPTAGWKSDWAKQVRRVEGWTRLEWRQALAEFREDRPAGSKLVFRQTDRRCGACSAMMDAGVPVALMYHAGAPLVVRAGVTVLGLRPGDPKRAVVEAYPALVARALGHGRGKPYKVENGGDRGRAERARLIRRLVEAPLPGYGLTVTLAEEVEDAALADERGDALDAVFATVQAAWVNVCGQAAFITRVEASGTEGVIADPRAGATE